MKRFVGGIGGTGRTGRTDVAAPLCSNQSTESHNPIQPRLLGCSCTSVSVNDSNDSKDSNDSSPGDPLLHAVCMCLFLCLCVCVRAQCTCVCVCVCMRVQYTCVCVCVVCGNVDVSDSCNFSASVLNFLYRDL